jgi:hypothetical protein
MRGGAGHDSKSWKDVKSKGDACTRLSPPMPLEHILKAWLQRSQGIVEVVEIEVEEEESNRDVWLRKG